MSLFNILLTDWEFSAPPAPPTERIVNGIYIMFLARNSEIPAITKSSQHILANRHSTHNLGLTIGRTLSMTSIDIC